VVIQEILFNRKLLRQNRLRISKNDFKIFAQHNFLHHEIANRIAENVELLNREFGAVLEINGLDGYLADLLKAETFEGDEENLPFEPESFDLIVSNLNFHFINQIPQFLLQVKSLLKPNGIFIASFFGEENLSELAKVLYEVENEIYGGISPRMPPTIDVKTAASLIQKAGFQNPISDFDKIEVEYPNPLKLLQDLKNMGQGNILTKRSRKFFTKKFLTAISEKYLELYGTADGNIRATFEIVTMTGWK
jgi:NADH dehydrogenase [ubiquinone] 1 alpha subcomplex assembly factor 5